MSGDEEEVPFQRRELDAIRIPRRFEATPYATEAVPVLPLVTNQAALGELLYLAVNGGDPVVLKALLVGAMYHMVEGQIEVRSMRDMRRELGEELPDGTPIYLLKLALIGACGMVKGITNDNKEYLPRRWSTLVKAMEGVGMILPEWELGNVIALAVFLPILRLVCFHLHLSQTYARWAAPL